MHAKSQPDPSSGLGCALIDQSVSQSPLSFIYIDIYIDRIGIFCFFLFHAGEAATGPLVYNKIPLDIQEFPITRFKTCIKQKP